MYSSALLERKRQQQEVFDLEEQKAQSGFLLNGKLIPRDSSTELAKLITCRYCSERVVVKGKAARCPWCERIVRQPETVPAIIDRQEAPEEGSEDEEHPWDQFKVPFLSSTSHHARRAALRDRLAGEKKEEVVSGTYRQFLAGERGNCYGEGALPPTIEERAHYKWSRVLRSTYEHKKWKK